MANHSSDLIDQKDPMFSNKVAAAVLSAGLIFAGLPILVNTFVGGGHGGGHHGGDHHGDVDPNNLLGHAVPIEVQLSAAPTEEKVYDLGALMAEASVAAGEKASAVCKSCHTFEKGGANGTGPNLWGIVDRPVASVSGFSYSGALVAYGGTWNWNSLDNYLKNSQSYIPGTSMAQKIRKDPKRANMLAYLGSLSDAPVAYPEPLPPVEEAAATEEAMVTEDEAPVEVPAMEMNEAVVEAVDAVDPSELEEAPTE